VSPDGRPLQGQVCPDFFCRSLSLLSETAALSSLMLAESVLDTLAATRREALTEPLREPPVARDFPSARRQGSMPRLAGPPAGRWLPTAPAQRMGSQIQTMRWRKHQCQDDISHLFAPSCTLPTSSAGRSRHRSWFRHDRPHSGRGGCLGGVARHEGGLYQFSSKISCHIDVPSPGWLRGRAGARGK
jgi:hypothetical protein